MDSDGVEQAHRFKPGGCEIVKWISISQLLHIGCLLLSPGVSNLKVVALNKTKQVKCTKQLLCDGSQQAYRVFHIPNIPNTSIATCRLHLVDELNLFIA